jgi:predicted phage terminase large subunit-like protein
MLLEQASPSRPAMPPRRHRVRLEPDVNTILNTEVLSPEALAYALPGGLAKLAFPKFIYNPFIRDVENRILRIAEEKEIAVMLAAPPRHGKTLFLSRVLPAWFLGRFPDKRVLLITYQDNFSRTQSRQARNILKQHGNAVFGINVAEDTAAANAWDIQNHEGGMEAVGAGGAITGKGADLLIVDDLIKGRQQALNENILMDMWEWFRTDVLSRLEPGASIIIMNTRWTMSDVIGMILECQRLEEEGELDDEDASFSDFEYFNYPALAEENDILGRLPGQALFPQRWDEAKLKKRKARNDDYWWSALYQGNPVPLSGEIIDTGGFKRQYEYAKPPSRELFDMVVISADTAIKDTELADFSVFEVWGIKPDGYYLLDLIREKFQYPILKETCLALARVWRPEFVLIEDKGSGSSLVQDMRTEGNFQVMPIDPGNESKVLRMQAETPTIKSGMVVLPDHASWKEDFLIECRSFPRGKKDQVDAFSQFLKFARQTTSGIKMW